jgi:hypothetical protein
LLLQHDMRAREPAPALQEAAEQRGGAAERRIRDHVKRAAGEAHTVEIGLHHDQLAAEAGEPITQTARATGVQLDRDHAHARAQQRLGDGAVTRAAVEYEAVRRKCGVSDESPGPLRVEPVPSPLPRSPVHGGGPSRR